MIGSVVPGGYVERKKVWRFPAERFVEYEPKDEAWCRAAGIGREDEEVRVSTIPRIMVTNIDFDSRRTRNLLVSGYVLPANEMAPWE